MPPPPTLCPRSHCPPVYIILLYLYITITRTQCPMSLCVVLGHACTMSFLRLSLLKNKKTCNMTPKSYVLLAKNCNTLKLILKISHIIHNNSLYRTVILLTVKQSTVRQWSHYPLTIPVRCRARNHPQQCCRRGIDVAQLVQPLLQLHRRASNSLRFGGSWPHACCISDDRAAETRSQSKRLDENDQQAGESRYSGSHLSPCVNVASRTFHLSGGKDDGMRRRRTGTTAVPWADTEDAWGRWVRTADPVTYGVEVVDHIRQLMAVAHVWSQDIFATGRKARTSNISGTAALRRYYDNIGSQAYSSCTFLQVLWQRW